ncbi:hypothetical protein CG709_18370, partial [Lachnotalea glycerini]
MEEIDFEGDSRMDLEQVNAYMAMVEKSETTTNKPIGNKLKVGPVLGTANIVTVESEEEKKPGASEKQ